MPRYLIVAYQTAGGVPLRDAVEELTGEEPDAEFVLLVPATHTQHLFTWTEGESRAVADEKAAAAAELLREHGVHLTDVRVGDSDPFVAVSRELTANPGYDGIIVSTFPVGISRWLRMDLAAKLEKATGLSVTQVITDPEDESPPEETPN